MAPARDQCAAVASEAGCLCAAGRSKQRGCGEQAEGTHQALACAATSLCPHCRQAKQQTHRVGLDGTHQAVRLLGRGAAGEIWLFRDVKTRKMVAVKLFERPLDPGAVSAVLREIKVNLTCRMVTVRLC